MPEKNVITIGTAAQDHDILTTNIPKHYIIEKHEVIIINFTKKDEILKSLKVESKIQDIENNIIDEYSITNVEDIFSLMNKYTEINKNNKTNNLNQIENKLIKLHNDKFEQLLNKENYSLESIDDNIEKYEELKSSIEKLQKNIRFVSNTSLKNVITDEINLLSNKKNIIGSKLIELLNCDEASLELTVKSQLLINTINNSNLSEEIDNAIIENNYVDYINLGQRIRKKALTMFMEKSNKRYTTIEEVNDDLDIIVKEFKRRDYAAHTIEVNLRG